MGTINANKAGLGVVAILAAAGLLYLFDHDSPSPPLIPPAQRKPITELALPTLDGPIWSLGEQRGRVVLLNFWATWCAPCRHETPALIELSRRYQAQGLSVAGVAMDEGGSGPVRAFVTSYQVPYPILIPSPTGRDHLSNIIEALPTTILFDRQGRVAQRYLGSYTQAAFARDIEKLLAEN